MPDIDNLGIDIKASADKAISSLTKVKDALASVGGETTKTTKSTKDSANAFEASAKGVAAFARELRSAGFKHVADDLGTIQKRLKLRGLEDLTKAGKELAASLEQAGHADLAGVVRNLAENPAAREGEWLEADRAEREAMQAVLAAAKDAERQKREELRETARVAKEEWKRNVAIARESERAYVQITQEAARQRAAAERQTAQEIAAKERQAMRERTIGARALAAAQKQAAKEAAAAERQAAKDAERAAKEREVAEKEAAEQADKTKAALVSMANAAAAPIMKLGAKIKSLVNTFFRIAMYRAVRSAIKAISSAIKEGLTNLEAYSREVGTAFTPAVDNLRRHVLMLKNAFATALRPVIEALIPIIIQLVDWFSKLADFAAQVLSVLTGKVDDNNRYTKAVLGDLEQSNKEAKELRRTLLGFDEINRLDAPTNSGSDNTNAVTMFEQADVSPEAAAVAEKIAKAWEKIKDFVSKVDWAKVAKIVAAVLALKAGIGLVQKLKAIWGVLKPIAQLIGKAGIWGAVIAIVAIFAVWGDKISAWIDKAKEKVNDFLNKLKGGRQAWNAVVETVQAIVTLVSDTIGTIASMVYKLFHGDFKGAFNDLIHLLAVLVKGIVGIAVGLFNIILGYVSDMVNDIIDGAVWIYNKGVVPVFNWIITAAQNVKIWFHNAFVDLQIGFWSLAKVLINAANWALGKIEKAINAAIELYNTVTGNSIKPINLQIDSSSVDNKIKELENKKLEPITETLKVVTEIKDPKHIKLHVDASGAYDAVDRLEKKITSVANAIAAANKALPKGLAYTQMMTYASGGFPSMGTVFIAGESGAEYVGDIGGRTGVMNTDQMAQAMYKAMVSALANMPQQGGDIYLDGEVIYRNTVRRNNNHVRSTGRAALLT